MKTKSTSLQSIYFILISCIFPLFLTNFYYNVQLSKSMFFLITTYLTYIGVIIFAPRQTFSFTRDTLSLHNACPFLSLCIFILSTLISAFLSDYGIFAFTGGQGRYMGFFMILSMGICFILFSQFFSNRRFPSAFLYIGSSLTALLGILQFIQIDPLCLSANTPTRFTGMYLSTIGHINTFSGYISMTSAFCIASYCLCRKRFLLLPSLLGYVALFAGNSDTGFFCIGTVLIILFFFLKTPEEVSGLLDQLLLFGFSCIIGHILSFRALIPYQGIPALFSQPEIALTMAVLFLFLRSGVNKFINSKTRLRILKRMCAAVMASFAFALLLLLLLVNLHLIDFSPFLLDDNWGSYRGFIWRKVWEVYLDAPLRNKLFGYGPDTLKPLLLRLCKEEMLSITTKIYDSAHNDFLQYLITTGFLGAASWLFFLLSVLIHTIKARQKKVLPWLTVLIAYLIQTLFIPTQPITAPLGFMAAGICVGMTRE